MRQLLVLLALAGCAPDPRAPVLEALAEDVAQRYEDFATQATTLAEAGCAPSARDAWWAARAPWKAAEIVQFGPVVDYPGRFGPKLDDWPARPDAIEALVAADTPLDAAAFDAMGSATRGLPVVEYLLWGEAPTGRRCDVLAGASADVARNAAALLAAWRDGQTTWGSPGDDPTPQAVLDEWVNRVAFTVENLRGLRLGVPLGDRSGGEPQPDAEESRFSGRALQDAADILAGVEAVWRGASGPGLRALVDDDALAARIDGLFTAAAARLAEVPAPLMTTVAAEPELIRRAQDALRALQVAVQVELAPALDVTITFNDNDGD